MSFLIYFFIFLFGLAVGSFLNCIIYRLEEGESFLRGRSFCPHCGHILSFGDLIPVLSFLILKGKCRYCSQKISLQYPLVELATVIIFLTLYYNFFTMVNLLQFIFLLAISCFLIIIFVYDLKHYIIPDKIIYPAIAIALIYQLFRIWNLHPLCGYPVSNFAPHFFKSGGSNFRMLANPLLSAILAGLFFLIIVLISRGKWMGVGDIKLAFLIGLILGFPKILVALFLAFLIGAIIGLGLVISGKKTLKSEVPFGPFLVSGTFIALFWGQSLINWYAKILYFG